MKSGRIIHTILCVVICMVICNNILFNSSKIETDIAHYSSNIVKNMIDGEVKIGTIHLSYPLGMSIEDILIHDVYGDTLIAVSKAYIQINPLSIIKREIEITRIKLIHPYINIYRESDSLATNIETTLTQGNRDDNRKSTSLRVNSIYIKNGEIAYNVRDKSIAEDFDKNHILISQFTTSLSVKHLDSNSISATVRRLSLAEQSGFTIKKTKGRVSIGKHGILLENLSTQTANSLFKIDRVLVNLHNGQPTDCCFNLNCSVNASDFAPFLPALEWAQTPITLALSSKVGTRGIDITQMELSSHGFNIDIAGGIDIESSDSLLSPFNYRLRDLVLNSDIGPGLYNHLKGELQGFKIELPTYLCHIDNSHLRVTADGALGNLIAEAQIESAVGELLIDIQENNFLQTLLVRGKSINLGSLLNTPDLGSCNLDISLHNHYSKQMSLASSGRGVISSLWYKGYNYNDIEICNRFSGEECHTTITLADPNADISLESNIERFGNMFDINITTNIPHLDLSRLNIASQDSVILATKIALNAVGNSIDNISGRVDIDSLLFQNSLGKYLSQTPIELTIDHNNNRDNISLTSDVVSMDIVGNYTLSLLPYTLASIFQKSLPTIDSYLIDKLHITPPTRPTDDHIIMDLTLQPTNLYQLLKLPFNFDYPAYAQLHTNRSLDITDATILLPQIMWGEQRISNSKVTMNIDNQRADLELNGMFGNGTKEHSIALNIEAHNDSLNSNLSWRSTIEREFCGDISVTTLFQNYDKVNGWLKSRHSFMPSLATYRDVDWEISPMIISTDSLKIGVKELALKHDNQRIYIDGTLSTDTADIVNIELESIDIGQIFSILRLDNLNFGGIATANITSRSILHHPAISGTLGATDFTFMGTYGGDLNLSGRWNETLQCIDLYARMNSSNSSSTISGGFWPAQNYIDVDIEANRTDLTFLNTFTSNVFKHVGGNAIGTIKLFGPLSELDLSGEAILENGELEQSTLNTTFYIKHDTLRFQPGVMDFTGVDFYDEFNHKGELMCTIHHNKLKDFSVDMDARIQDMQVLDIPRTETNDIYARLFATGSIELTTNNTDGLVVNANASTSTGTRFGYNLSAEALTDNNFLQIVDAERGVDLDEERESNVSNRDDEPNSNVTLNLHIDCRDNAEILLQMDPLDGSFYGSGIITAKYSTIDGISLNGSYNVLRGHTTLSLENLIRKEFKLSSGSYVNFVGHPSNTELNLHTTHMVNSASLTDLDASASSEAVRVNCMMDITGTVNEPTLSFNIDLPQGTLEEKSLVTSAVSTEEQRNLQFMYLLAIGRFYSYDYANNNTSTTPGAVESLLNSTINTQINNLLSQIIDTNDISLSSNVTAGSYLNTDPANLTNKEFEGILEAHLLNNRLLINGNFGYRENVMTNTSNFIGDFEVEWLLTKRPRISLRGYNRNNDKYFSKTSLTTQGIGLVYEVDLE